MTYAEDGDMDIGKANFPVPYEGLLETPGPSTTVDREYEWQWFDLKKRWF